ncbi:MAG: hypothetical protein FIB07_02435 [Candidatus Methanoperedens sp.]|nr:hypothetical protein [Candidatus Methanoperedens sp.]
MDAIIMKDREIFFGTGILTIMVGFFLLVFVQSITMDLGGGNFIQVSTIFDGGFLILMGIAIVLCCLKEWDSEKGKKPVMKK